MLYDGKQPYDSRNETEEGALSESACTGWIQNDVLGLSWAIVQREHGKVHVLGHLLRGMYKVRDAGCWKGGKRMVEIKTIELDRD